MSNHVNTEIMHRCLQRLRLLICFILLQIGHLGIQQPHPEKIAVTVNEELETTKVYILIVAQLILQQKTAFEI